MTDLVLAPRADALEALEPDHPARRLVAAFLSGRSRTTLRSYGGDLVDFAAFLGAATSEDAVAQLLVMPSGTANETVLRYRNAMLDREKPLSPATVNRRLAALRSIVKLARTLGMVSWSIEIGNVESKAYRDTRGPGEVLFEAMLQALIERGDEKAIRDYAIVRALHDLGMRRGEVCSLDLKHFSSHKGVFLLGKGRREREWFTMPVKLRDAIEDWISLRGDASGPLFFALDPHHRGHRLTGAAIYAIVRTLGHEVAGKEVIVRPHGLRHTAITTAARKTEGNHVTVQAFARHANANTTAKYIDNSNNERARVARLVSGDE